MKQIPVQLLTSYKKANRSTCFLVKVVDRDGIAHGFTTLDAVVSFNDGLHSVKYMPNEELRPQNLQSTLDLEVDNTEFLGWFSEAVEQTILAGRFSSAEITLYRVAYLNLSHGAEVVAYGTVGQIEYATNKQGKRKIEYRSLAEQINLVLNDLYSLTCRADFGDEDCGMPFVWESATIEEIQDSRIRFKVEGITRPDNWFVLGVLEFLDGPNEGKTLEIESWSSDGWLTLTFVSPYPAQVGGAVRIRQDCDKTAGSCKAYGNIINMQAEHLTPVQDQALMVPGAYIKSQNAL